MGLKIYKNTPQKKIRRNPWVSGVQIFPSASQFPATFATFARQKYLEVVVHLRDGGSSVGDLFEHGGVAWTRRGRTSDWWIFHDLKRSLLGWNTTSSGRTFIWLVVWKIFFPLGWWSNLTNSYFSGRLKAPMSYDYDKRETSFKQYFMRWDRGYFEWLSCPIRTPLVWEKIGHIGIWPSTPK